MLLSIIQLQLLSFLAFALGIALDTSLIILQKITMPTIGKQNFIKTTTSIKL